ncbi:hypothetical protein L6R46_29955 [Myxococcota bacterium]|nr:hypothetical protein [Myxococcota bacterium]
MPLSLLLLGCVTAPPEGAAPPSPNTPDTAAQAPEPVDCSVFCADTTTDANIPRCYACRCKAAMDGWLPSPEELQCSRGEAIVTYTTDAEGTLTPVVDDAASCTNPSLLYGTCTPGGTLGQLSHGDVSVKWICRRYNYGDDYSDPNAPYDDVGAILYNARTGASCWFDDMDGTGLTGDNWPDMDLTRPDADVAAWTSFFLPHRRRGLRRLPRQRPVHLHAPPQRRGLDLWRLDLGALPSDGAERRPQTHRRAAPRLPRGRPLHILSPDHLQPDLRVVGAGLCRRGQRIRSPGSCG